MKAEVKELSSYEVQANEFLKATNTEFKAEFLNHGKHFEGDEQTRDIYIVTLKRGNREYKFNFGQSINCSGEYIVRESLRNKLLFEKDFRGKYAFTTAERKKLFLPEQLKKDVFKNENFSVPTAYDVLTCLQKYDVGTLENFCSEFGYDTDSKKAEKIYNAVLNEYKNVCMLWNETEIEQLQEIQ